MKVYILGSAGWIPDDGQTSCFMVEQKNKLLLLDCGTGVSRLKEYADVLANYDEIHIILSHYHLDHLIGLIYLLPYIKEKNLYIYGPGKPVYDKSTQEYLETLLQTAFFSRPLHAFCQKVTCSDYAGKDFQIDDISIKIHPQKHSAPSFRITVDDNLIYATDTMFDKEEWETSYPEKTVLLHECWAADSSGPAKHSTLSELKTGLPGGLKRNTYLIHKNPEWSKSDLYNLKKEAEQDGITLAKDKMVISID